MTARAARCGHCGSALADADQTLHVRYDKIKIPEVKPVVTRVERYAGHCPCCGGTTLAQLPDGLGQGSPFSINIVALAMYLRFVHAVSYRRLSRRLLDLYGLCISEGALDAAFRRGKPRSTPRSPASSPGRAARAPSFLTRPRCAWTAGLAGTGCSRTRTSSST